MRTLLQQVATVDVQPWINKFNAGANTHAGTDGAIDFLVWVVRNDRNSPSNAADTLMRDHVGSAALLPFAKVLASLGRSLGTDRVREICTTLIEQNSSASVQAQAIHSRAQLVLRDRNATAAAKAKAEQDLLRIPELVPGSILALKVEGPKFQEQRLQIGMVAPDIIAEDLDGTEFKLSDYRGKVVVIDFWGDW